MILDNYAGMLIIIVLIMHEFCMNVVIGLWFTFKPSQILAGLATLVCHMITRWSLVTSMLSKKKKKKSAKTILKS